MLCQIEYAPSIQSRNPNPATFFNHSTHGVMNVDFSESYDHESDIYYVTFKTGEPSMVFETDDDLLLEVGLFTHTPTGFRILNFSKDRVKAIAIQTTQIQKAFSDAKNRLSSYFDDRQTQVGKMLEKMLA
jgi:hypothetical protein